MLEKLGAWVLNLYLGDYLELNTDQLSVGILSGQVELENIPLKQDAFDKFDLPLQVRSGMVGKISLSIPVAEMRSQPWVINISDVHIVVEPNTKTKYDEESQKKRSDQNKKQMLQELEDSWKLERKPEAPTSYYGSWLNYGSGIASNIMENLQLNLSGLHLRYQSSRESTGTNYAFGLVIEKLVAQSTDSTWMPQYVSGNAGSPVVHKLVELVGLSLYWDHNTEYLSTAASLKQQSASITHNYLLSPVSGKALVQRNTSVQPLKSQNEPRLNVELQFDNFLLSLDDVQYGGIASLINEFDHYEKRKPYRRTRPDQPVHRNCRSWWYHAIESELSCIRVRNERTSKEYLLKRSRNCVSYVSLYHSFLLMERLASHQNKLKQEIEDELDFETLKTLRQIAVTRLKNAGKWDMVPAQPNTGYLNSWITWYSGKPADTPPSSDSQPDLDTQSPPSSSSTTSLASSDAGSGHALRLTSKERATLEEEWKDWVGSSEPAEARSTLNKDNVFLHLTFVLHQVNFTLKQHTAGTSDSQGLVQLECHDIRSAAVIRPRSRSTKFSLGLGGLFVKDLYNTSTQFPLLISPRQLESGSRTFGVGKSALPKSGELENSKQSDLFYFEIEKNPVRSDKDIMVQVKTQPLDVIYNEGVVRQVRQFFSPRHRARSMSKAMSESHLAERARRRYEQLKNKTKIDIQDTWQNLLNTSTAKVSKRVGLRLDISAPQLIVPRDLCDSQTHMVVFDLGKLRVTNQASQDDEEPKFDLTVGDRPGVLEPEGDMDVDMGDDDDFMTPPSTPPEPESESVSISGSSVVPSVSRNVQELSGDELYTNMYDRYDMLLADIQVLIVSRKDNWRILTNRGFSHLHVVDKLSVNIHFERRLLLTADPEWPAIKVSATMERLSVHVSPLKVSQLKHCVNKLTAQSQGDSTLPASQSASTESCSSQSSESRPRMVHSQSRLFAPPETRSVLDNSKVVKCDLDIHQMSLDIHNRERCLVELQVAGVKAEFTKLPSETDVTFTVHSFIIADALQSYGADFDLLVASHRNVRLDSKSGSMCSSVVASPTTPRSPQSPRSPEPEYHNQHQPARKQTSYTSFQTAVVSGIQKLLPVATATPLVEHSGSGVRSPSVSSTNNRPLSPVFLGEPLIKVDFVHTNPERCEDSSNKSVDIVFNSLDLVANQETVVELLAFFNEVMPKGSSAATGKPESRAPKDETSTTPPDDSNDKSGEEVVIQAEFRKLNILLHCPDLSASLSPRDTSAVTKVAIVNMTGAKIEAAIYSGTLYTVEAELGGLQVADLSPASLHTHVFAFGNMSCDQISNLDQTIPAHMYQTCVGELTTEEERKAFHMVYDKANVSNSRDRVVLGIGSIQYIHVPRFLSDLHRSVSLFHEYIENAKQKIKDAATEVAGFFVKPSSTDHKPTPLCDMDIEVTLDAPLLVLPCSTSTTQVLVAELGKMTISNQADVMDTTHGCTATDSLDIQIRDMKLVTKEVDPLKVDLFGQEVIMEEAGVNLTVVHNQIVESQAEAHTDGGDFHLELSPRDKLKESTSRRAVSLFANVPHALEVSLSRQAYDLILQAIQTADASAAASTSHHSTSATADTEQQTSSLSTPPQSSDSMLYITAAVTLPIVSVAIKDQLGGAQAQGIVELKLQELSIAYEKINPHIATLKLELTSLSALDLLQPEDSKHRYLALSLDKSVQRGSIPKFISTSLPGTLVRSRKRKRCSEETPFSLPSSISSENIKQRPMPMDVDDTVPTTPPSSPREGTAASADSATVNNLVTITVSLIDKSIPHFSTDHGSINTEVDIDFNSLEIVVNQETWVMVLDFFGLGAKVFTPEQQHEVNTVLKSQPPTEGMKAKLSVKSFSVVFVKKCYDLAKANINRFQVDIIKQQQTTKMAGVLGSLCVDDLSPHGCLHSCKFTTQAGSAVDSTDGSALLFNVLKHDVPDERLERDFDISVDLQMSSVIYTLTKRFPTEIINFLQDFLEHHDNIGHMRAASSGQKLPDGPGHSARVKLNIRAGTPIIILPGSSLSEEVIVMHLGNLTVSNRFLFAGAEGTLAHGKEETTGSTSMQQPAEYNYDPMTSSLYCSPGQSLDSVVEQNSQSCLLDVMSVRLTDMNLYSAKRVEGTRLHPDPSDDDRDIRFKGYYFAMDQNQPLKERCVLNLVVERNLDNDLSHSSPEIAVRGTLSTVYCHLDVEQYKLVRAVLDQNLGEELNDLQRVAKQLPHIQTILSGNVWTVLDISVDLHNVTIELLHEHKTLSQPVVSLARLDFITSNLAFVSYSNQSKDIDLVSHEIRVTDTRSVGLSVFRNILQPTHEAVDKPTVLHMELHLRSSKLRNCASVLFNNMRIFCVMDWLVSLKDYISSNAEKKLLSQVPRVSQTVAPSLLNEVVETMEEGPKLEVKMNLTDTELVLVEDLSSSSSNAIILKTTAVSHYQPGSEHRPLICNLQKLELFSCCLSDEGSTALSIIDPFDVTLELLKSRTVHEGILAHRLEVNLSELRVRFSYNDFLLIKRIMKSLPQQLQSAINPEETPSSMQSQAVQKADSKSLAITSVEVSTQSLSICLINDCADMDVPLLDLKLKDFGINQTLSTSTNESAAGAGHVTFEDPIAGALKFCMSLNYYNRMLSGWEPLVEPWRFKVAWTGNPMADDNLNVKATASDVINLNITSAALDMVQNTRELWNSLVDRHGSIMQPITSRESFVPYSLHNQTGRALLFAIVTKEDGTTSLPTSWTEVQSDQNKPFSFITYQMKQRHQDTHKSTNHRLVVMVEGWQKTSPVSIDKVGQFFRTMQTDPHSHKYQHKVVASRVVFDIVCMENASKCITVKSPVTVENKTSYNIESRLESLVDKSASHVLTLAVGTSQSLPLAFMFCQMWFRPAGDEMMTYTDAAVRCQSRNMKAGESKSTPLTCNSILDSSQSFRLSAVIRQDYYPSEAVMETLGEDTLYQPGHTVTLLSPLTIVNLLPVELGYLIYGSVHTGKLKSGKEDALHEVDTSAHMRIDFAAEGYHKGGVLHINSSTSDHLINVRLYDSLDRLLLLDAKITRLALGSVQIIISVKYWLINHTGLPLVFKQVGTKGSSAGQFEEHELARSVAPLMFSFAEREQPDLCAMRLGNTVHTSSTSSWSNRFSIDKGNHVRRLRVTPSDGRPDWVYNIGVEVKRGSGRYQDSNMVILVPYNKIINKSSHRIAFTQKHLVQKNEVYQASLPGSRQAYHWPRHDLDPLLCIRLLDIPNMLWSGGFRIDQLNSFVINHRCSDSGDCTLMKVETVLQGSTFTTILADASDIPPPMRVENYTDLSLKYWQTEVGQEEFKTIVKPKSSVAYAWDEPTLASTITCAVHCDMGSSESTYDMNVPGQGDHLEYENYFYIQLMDSEDSLVLDVMGGNKIVFSHREPGRRSQLWSQSVEGRLIHEGISSGSSRQQRQETAKYCLDIAELAVIAEGCSCLSLRKVDSRRLTTQTWKFLEDGRLTCGSKTQCVQSLPAFGDMRAGARVALGPFDHKQPPSVGSRLFMAKMLPGSGVLSVNIHTDGPTRVLRVADIHDIEKMKGMKLNSSTGLSPSGNSKLTSRQIQLTTSVPAIGLSLVNHVREELLYLSLTHIRLKLEQPSKHQNVYIAVREVQVDNQLTNTACPLILCAQPLKTRQSTGSHYTPAIEVEWQRVLGVQSSMHVFKLLSVQVTPCTLDIEELLLFKTVEMFSAGSKDSEDMDIGRMQLPKDQHVDVNVRKYYFALLKVACGELTLSVHTTKLPKHLKTLKRSLAMTPIINFENAVIDFQPFLQLHPFESFSFLVTAVGTHFKQELQGQAGKIFGAVDVLGNPLGLVNDVTTGISGLVTEGDVGMLFKNVTHGASNSLAKVTGTLSKGLGWMTMDEQHEESRELIKRQYTGSNVLLGVKSLGHGVMGGITSIFHQTMDGATQKGFEGMITGFGKGVVGTVTKPVVGVLDFASGAATALRDTSGGGAGVKSTVRKRKPRCCYGKDGLLPVYKETSALGQQVLSFLSSERGDRRLPERYMDHIRLSSSKTDSYSLLASDQAIYVVKMENPAEEVLLATQLSELLSCTYVRKEKADRSVHHYLEVKHRQLSESGGSHSRLRSPQVRCDSADIAEQVVLLVDHAQSLYDEMLHTVSATNTSLD